MTPREALDLATKHFGSERALAKAIGFAPHAIWRAKYRGKPTAEMCVNISVASNGAIKREWLRPDLFGDQSDKLIVNPWTAKRGHRRDQMGHAAR